jgi:DNA-binding XRE family transcriptional regulator
MKLLTARVKNAERMMTSAKATKDSLEIRFADGCGGIIPFSAIPEIGDRDNILGIDMPNPYEIIIRSLNGESAELPWDFARHYCDSAYKPREITLAATGMQSLGKRIAAMRQAAGMTQAELAKAASIGRVTLVRIEKGEQSLRYETLMMIAKALGRPAAEVLGGETTDLR